MSFHLRVNFILDTFCSFYFCSLPSRKLLPWLPLPPTFFHLHFLTFSTFLELALDLIIPFFHILTMSLLTLPPPPKSWDTNKDYVIHSTISPCYKQPIEPAGREFMAVARRHRHKRTLSEDERIEQALEDASAEDVSMEEDEPETPKLLRSDPLKWKVISKQQVTA